MTEEPAKTPGWDEQPLSYARALSWISLVLILCTSLGISVIITNSARESLLTKQTDFALLLAENLNHQIYRRFTLPLSVLFGGGSIPLRQPAVYERLDHVVLAVIHGWQLKSLRIYDRSATVAYSIDKEEFGNESLAGAAVGNAMQGGAPEFEIISAIPMWKALFMVARLEPGSFVLRTTFPLRVPPSVNAEGGDQETPMPMGVLEFHQDITEDFKAAIAFQWLIVGTIMLSSAVLFTLLLVFIRRADRVLALRLAQNRALEENLHMNERLVGMGRVVASIAHEIRNPLGIIRSSAELLLRRAGQTDSRTSGILQAIYDEAIRLSQTVNDFLDYARPRRPRQDPVDLVEVLQQVLAFQSAHIERQGVQLVLDLEESLPIKGDKDLLYRAVYNLVANALQAMQGAGSLYVSGRAHANGRVELTLRDSGPGFDPQNLPRVMDPFFTTKDSGTGLGLPIVNSIVSSHGGSIRLENAAGGGAVAHIFLPGPANAPLAAPLENTHE